MDIITALKKKLRRKEDFHSEYPIHEEYAKEEIIKEGKIDENIDSTIRKKFKREDEVSKR